MSYQDKFGEILDVLNATLKAGGFNTFQRIGEMSAVIELNDIKLIMEGRQKWANKEHTHVVFIGVIFRQWNKWSGTGSKGTKPVIAPEDVFRKYIKAYERIICDTRT